MTDRRRFLALAGLAGVTAMGGVPMALAQTGAGTPPRRPASPPVPPSAPAPTPPEISEDARALAAVIRRRYGRHLDARQIEAIAREIDGRLQGGQRLRAVKLANGDEPDFTFGA